MIMTWIEETVPLAHCLMLYTFPFDAIAPAATPGVVVDMVGATSARLIGDMGETIGGIVGPATWRNDVLDLETAIIRHEAIFADEAGTQAHRLSDGEVTLTVGTIWR
jgi:hypothetical protein